MTGRPTRASLAMIGGSLILGLVLGLMLQGMLHQLRLSRIGALRREDRFVRHMESIIQPRPDQQVAVEALLRATGAHDQQIISKAHAELRASLELLHRQLQPLLDADQWQRLQRMGRLPDPFDGRPPGPPRPPR
jgi:hypothetical protein